MVKRRRGADAGFETAEVELEIEDKFMKRTCKQCGKEFEIFQSEINFYKSKNLQLPRRCKECREANKQKKPEIGERIIQEKKTEETPPVVLDEPSVPTPPAKTEQRDIKSGFKNKLLYFAAAVLIVILSQFLPGRTDQPTTVAVESGAETAAVLTFRNETLLNDHYQKHGVEMGFASAQEYQEAAAAVAGNENALHKTEAEDGDDVYYLVETNEFVIVSTDGYLRTYFNPDDGIDYYNRQ